jgi:hypothetical protein
MNEHDKIEELTVNLKRYVTTNCELLKLETTDHVSEIGAGLISAFFICVTGALVLFFISLGIGYYISFRLGDNYSGLLIVSGFYFIIWLILIIGKNRLIKIPIRDKLISMMFNKKQT